MISTPVKEAMIDDLAAKREYTAIRIFMALEKYELAYHKPQPAKIFQLQQALRDQESGRCPKKDSIIHGLRLLIKRGYIVETERDGNTRMVKLCINLPPQRTHSAA